MSTPRDRDGPTSAQAPPGLRHPRELTTTQRAQLAKTQLQHVLGRSGLLRHKLPSFRAAVCKEYG